MPHVDILLGILSQKIDVVSRFTYVEGARHTGVSICYVKTAQVSNIPVCIFLHCVHVRWCLHHQNGWGPAWLCRTELAFNWETICLYSSWRRRNARWKTLLSSNAGWETCHGGISKHGGTASSSAIAATTAAACSCVLFLCICHRIRGHQISHCLVLHHSD
jgi:hypothetical protein